MQRRPDPRYWLPRAVASWILEQATGSTAVSVLQAVQEMLPDAVSAVSSPIAELA